MLRSYPENAMQGVRAGRPYRKMRFLMDKPKQVERVVFLMGGLSAAHVRPTSGTFYFGYPLVLNWNADNGLGFNPALDEDGG